jgi:hypothetical protein
MKKIVLTVTIVIFLAPLVSADPGDTLWTRTYGYLNWEQGWSADLTSDGRYIIAGWTRSLGSGDDFYLIKTDASGNALWDRNYGGSSQDVAYSVQQTSEGGYIIVGYTESYGAGLEDYYIVKTNSIGDTLWTRVYGGSSTDYGHCVQQTFDGGYIIVGTAYSFASFCDFWLLKTDSSGDTLWTRTYGDSYYDYGWSVQQTSDGGYIVAGTGAIISGNGYDMYIVKTDSSGDTLWTSTYGGTDPDFGRSVQQTSDGGYIIAGYTESYGAGLEDFYIVKTDPLGDTLWTRVYGGINHDYAYSVDQTSDGGYIITGETNSFGSGGNYDVYLVKTNSFGDTLWTRRYGGDWNEEGWAVRETYEGGYIIAGLTNSYGAGNYDVWLLRIEDEELPAVSIDMIPDNPPVIVNPGGYFTFTGTIRNNTANNLTGDVWIMLDVPGIGTYGPIERYNNIHLAPNQSITVTGIRQNIPGFAPLGVYDYIAYGGNYPVFIADSAAFQFTVVSPARGVAHSWNLSGWFDADSRPVEYSLHPNCPNPFNPVTTICYDLPVATHVDLEVYNLMGQKVATLVDGWTDAGCHSVTWDATRFASGIYFYRLAFGDDMLTRRMTLLK